MVARNLDRVYGSPHPRPGDWHIPKPLQRTQSPQGSWSNVSKSFPVNRSIVGRIAPQLFARYSLSRASRATPASGAGLSKDGTGDRPTICRRMPYSDSPKSRAERQ